MRFALLFLLFALPVHAATYEYRATIHTEDYFIGEPHRDWYTPLGSVLGLELVITLTGQLEVGGTTELQGTWSLGTRSGTMSQTDITTDDDKSIIGWDMYSFNGWADSIELYASDTGTDFAFYFYYDYACDDEPCISHESSFASGDAGTWSVVPVPASGPLLISILCLIAMLRHVFRFGSSRQEAVQG